MGRAVEEERGGARTNVAVRKQLEALSGHAALREQIESFWLAPGHQRSPTWTDQLDINEVMLATSLAPDGCLVLPAAR